MFKITKDGATVAMTEAPNYIKQAENGCFVLCPEAEATGIAHNGTVYHLLGRPDMAGAEITVMLEETDAGVEIAKAADATGIVFVTMAEAGSVDATTAAEHADLFAPWAVPVAYTVGQIRRYTDGKLYKCVQAIRHKRTGRRTRLQACGRRFPIRRRNGRNGPSRLAHMTHTARTPRCRTMASIGPAPWTATCGSLACTGGRRCKPWALPTS